MRLPERFPEPPSQSAGQLAAITMFEVVDRSIHGINVFRGLCIRRMLELPLVHELAQLYLRRIARRESLRYELVESLEVIFCSCHRSLPFLRATSRVPKPGDTQSKEPLAPSRAAATAEIGGYGNHRRPSLATKE